MCLAHNIFFHTYISLKSIYNLTDLITFNCKGLGSRNKKRITFIISFAYLLGTFTFQTVHKNGLNHGHLPVKKKEKISVQNEIIRLGEKY